MFNAKFVSNCLYDNIDEIKIAALYYDNIDILVNNVYTLEKPHKEYIYGELELISQIRGAYECISPDFKANLYMLEKEGIISYVDSDDYTIKHLDESLETEINEPSQVMKIAIEQAVNLLHNNKWLFNIEKTENGAHVFLHNEATKIHNEFVNELNIGSNMDIEFLYNYYRNLLSYLLLNLMSGENTLTSSLLLNNYIQKFYMDNMRNNITQKNDIYYLGKPNLAIDALKLAMPDVSKLSIDDILELRYRLKDELLRFRYYMMELNNKISDNYEINDITYNSKKYAELFIKPSIDDLNKKIKDSKINIAEKFLEEIKDPKSYVPLLGNIFVNMPAHISLLLSMGIIGINTALNYYKEISDIKQNGLYYLIKLNR